MILRYYLQDNFKTMITDKTKALVATLYREGLTIAEICKRTGIRSSATIYNIVTELGIKGEKGKKRGTFSVVLTLPMELREWVEEQGEGLSELITKFAYSQSGCGNEKSDIADSNVGIKIAYSEPRGTSEKSGIAVTKVYEDEMPYSESGGKERISDIKTFYHNSESEPLGEPKNSDLGTTEPVRLRIVLLKNAHELASNTILSFVDENVVKSISWGLFGNMCIQLGADEIAVYENEGQLLWLWEIEKQSLI